MKKQLTLGILSIATVIIAISLGYFIGMHKQCTTIALYNDYKFTCDGRKIQGPNYIKEYVTHSWWYSSSN